MEGNIEFKYNSKEMYSLSDKIVIEFFTPEDIIMRQFDRDFRKLIIIGSGICKAYKYYDSRWRVCLGTLPEGSMIGEQIVLFNSDPVFSLECNLYTTIGMLP